MLNFACRCIALVLFLVITGLSAQAAPRILSVEKIWDQGEHNAFTDIVQWKDAWYCTFREADNHVGTDGNIRIIRSADGATWESCGFLTEEGIDLRDPKLSITPDNRLMVNMGGSHYDDAGKKLLGRRPRVSFSNDGKTYTAPKKICAEGDWLWRVTWHEGQAWGVSYDNRIGKEDEWHLRLYVSNDGENYRIRTLLEVTGRPNETTLRFMPDGTMVALVRREAASKFAWIGASAAPYVDWNWNETEMQTGGPNFTRAVDGTLWAGHRFYPGGAKTVLSRMKANSLEKVLEFPSGGDTSYPGFAWHEGQLWMTYYASHEGKTSIYLAKIALD
jgi:hypothetical protein